MSRIESLLRKRIVILDGPMGTMIQTSNNDLLNLTDPNIVRSIHRQYLEAGADIIETNTFNSNALSMADHKMEHRIYELNLAGARLARDAADEFENRFVAGAVGPTNRLFRETTLDALVDAYYEQTRGLMDGGVDFLLAETILDLMNGKAALFAFEKYFQATGKRVPVMASVTIREGQSMEELWNSVSAGELLSVGINCSYGGRHMRPYVEKLSSIAPVYVSCYPSAGLPNADGKYDEQPAETAEILREFAANGWVNIVGGCCGTTPAYIKAIAAAVRGIKPRIARRYEQ